MPLFEVLKTDSLHQETKKSLYQEYFAGIQVVWNESEKPGKDILWYPSIFFTFLDEQINIEAKLIMASIH